MTRSPFEKAAGTAVVEIRVPAEELSIWQNRRLATSEDWARWALAIGVPDEFIPATHHTHTCRWFVATDRTADGQESYFVGCNRDVECGREWQERWAPNFCPDCGGKVHYVVGDVAEEAL